MSVSRSHGRYWPDWIKCNRFDHCDARTLTASRRNKMHVEKKLFGSCAGGEKNMDGVFRSQTIIEVVLNVLRYSQLNSQWDVWTCTANLNEDILARLGLLSTVSWDITGGGIDEYSTKQTVHLHGYAISIGIASWMMTSDERIVTLTGYQQAWCSLLTVISVLQPWTFSVIVRPCGHAKTVCFKISHLELK